MSYADQVKHTNEQKLEALLKTLPSCCRIYLSSLTEEKASNTILAYARDLQVYFEYITREIPRFSDRPASALSTGEVGSITDPEAAGFVLFLRSYKNKDGIRRTNSSAGAKRKIGTVKNFYRFFCKSEVFDCNPMDVVATPKVTGPEGTRLDVSEAALLMDNVEFGNNLRGRQKKFHIREKNRDLALVYLMLSTGIRVSECVALDIDDIDTDERCLLLHKEGTTAAKIYYSDECNAYLMG
uniref:tyrosine-type recombinase/integrase n=1 Tax=Eubacterium cellulosolvens TaxID=29322 RepID=UPI000489125A|nr:tyrosine-type recombinase/integrase [[Eubacterium] cellulosolvens]